jgi:polysaccharide biosynthesis protein PslH
VLPPRFAILAPYLPAPANTGGRIRIYRLAKALAKHGTVDLYARYWHSEVLPEAGDVTPALAIYRQKHLFESGPFYGLWGITSRRVREATPRALLDALYRNHREQHYDAVIACHSYAAAAFSGLSDTVCVLDEHNIESQYAVAVRPTDMLESLRLHRWERSRWNLANVITTVSDRDAATIASLGFKAEVVSNGVACDEVTWVAPSKRTEHSILFVGAMSHPPNVRCALELAREVLPRIRRERSDATLTLCGRAPTNEVRALASSHIRVTGTVDSVQPWLSSAGAYVNFLQEGAGTSLKVPEALAAGVPMVTTEVGVRGFGFRDRVHGDIVHTPEQAAVAVLSLWNNPVRADSYAHAGRQLAETSDWNTLGHHFASLVLRAVHTRGRT